MRFQNITRESIVKAIKEVDDNPEIQRHQSSTYDVLYNGKRYPPKTLISIAYESINGEHLDHISFNGGLNTECFNVIESLGFKIGSKDRKNYFLFSPGENAVKWEEFYKEGKIAMGWNIGDISTLKTYKKLKQTLIDKSGKKHQSSPAKANWEFLNFLKDGDVIIPKKGKKKILGYGIVKSDYKYDDKKVAEGYECIRKVEWKEKGEWDYKIKMSDTLQHISHQKDIKEIEELVGGFNNDESKKNLNFHNKLDSILIDDFIFLLEKIDEIISSLGLVQSDKRLTFSAEGETLSFHIGNKYIIAYSTLKLSYYLLTLDKIKLDLPKNEFTRNTVLYKNANKKIVDQNVSHIIDAANKELLKKDEFPSLDSSDFRRAVFDKKYREKIIEKYSTNYWIFQGNPKVFDVIKYINESSSHNWSVHNHKKKIKIGDKVILWVTGKNAGSYALAEVTSKLYQEANKPEERIYYSDYAHEKYNFDKTYGKKKNSKIDIKITHNISKNPITKDMINNNGDLDQFKAGNQGTNFESNEYEYNAILNMIENKDSKNQLYHKIWFVCQGSSFTNDQGKKYLFAPEKDKKGNPKYYWSNVSKIKKGDVIVNYAHGIQGISIAKKDAYSGKNPHPQELWQNDGWKVDLDFHSLEPNIQYKEFNNYSKQLIKNLANIKGPIQTNGGVKQGYLFEFNFESIRIIREKYGKPFPSKIEELLFSNNAEITEFNKQRIMKNPKNQILFGPPGTGKTYRLSHEYFDDYTDNESKRSREELLDELLLENRYTWFDIIAAIIKDKGKVSVNDILNHELIKSKTRVQNGKTPRQTVWAEMLEHGQLGCENIKRDPEGRREPMIIWKDDDSKFDFNNMDVDELIVESVELLDKSQNLLENNTTPIKRYEFVTFHQAFSYEDFIEGIKPVMDDETDDIKYEIKSGVFKQICKRAENDPTNKYALFIDEINRGNVANIFGELITLIEPDKRKDMDNALSVKLPYSKSIFSVPNNLDIIGTMNTADRSVEALDTALRRRFEFEEMLPDSSLLSNIRCEGIDFERLLNTINGRIEKLLDKDHQIGHSYFMNSNNTLSITDLRGIFKNKIMPLLQEYFYGDFGKIGLVLGNSFIKENKEKTIFSKFTYDDHDLIDERKVYQLADINKLEATDFKSIYEKSE